MSALTDRDTNLQPTSHPVSGEKLNPTGDENEGQNVQQHKQVMERKVAENNGKQGQAYVSPSDAILSPASQKLAGFKQRQINKQSNKNPAARTLFARTPSNSSGGGFNDVDGGGER